MSDKPLDSSIPANNEKIIELYKKVKTGQLNPSPDFQRKLVWKRQHKINFIDTILMRYPFPEIYKAPGNMNIETLDLADLIVDGQQRVTTIVNFIDGTDIFALEQTPLKFSSLPDDEKKEFLNYEVSIRYLKNANRDQIKEIFQRINNTEYSLNAIERLNAQWGDSEFVCFGKQMIEETLTVDLKLLDYKMPDSDREFYLGFFHDKRIFSDNDNDRMLSLQYVLTLISTLLKGSYFRRNQDTQRYIELYNEDFDEATTLSEGLIRSMRIIEAFDFPESSYWLNKSNIFTLLSELYQVDTDQMDIAVFKQHLLDISGKYKDYQNNPETFNDQELQKYFEYAREGVNEVQAREHRARIVSQAIMSSMNI
jgi:hypothetical protein